MLSGRVARPGRHIGKNTKDNGILRPDSDIRETPSPSRPSSPVTGGDFAQVLLRYVPTMNLEMI